MNAQKGVLAAWLGLIALTTIRSVTDPKSAGFPSPSLYLGSGVLFTLLYVASEFAPTFAVAIAVGVDLSMLLQPYAKDPRAKGPLDRLAQVIGQTPQAPGSSGKAA